MSEHAQRTGGDPQAVYTGAQLLTDLTNGIWAELDAEKPQIDLYRRNLQRKYAELLASLVNSNNTSSELSGLARLQLQSLKTKIEVKNKDTDQLTKAHLELVVAMINAAFDTRVVQVQSAPAAPMVPRRGDGN